MQSNSDALMAPVAELLHKNHMSELGIENTMHLASAYNQLKYGRYDLYRREQYRHHFDELIRENGMPTTPLIEMKDGYAIDTSMSLPHLEQLLKDSAQIIRDFGGVRVKEPGAYRSYFQEYPLENEMEKYPAILDFAASSDVLSTVSHYLQCIPTLSTNLPAGIRFVESNAKYDDAPDVPHDSQLFHVDYYSQPNVYVIVLLEDVTEEKGPFCFLPASITREVAAKVNNWKKGVGYRFSDEQIYAHASPSDLIRMTYPKGTVLFIESSGCFHYGSRNSIQPRYLLMYGYTTACRTDLSEAFMQPRLQKVLPTDSRLRKMLLRKEFMD